MMKIASLALPLLAMTLPLAPVYAATGAGAAPTAQVNVADSMNEDLSFVEQEIVTVAKTMPADRYDFAPESLGISGSDFKGVRSFGEQAKHIAIMNYVFFSGLNGPKPDVDPATIAKLTTKEDILAALSKSFDYAHRCISGLTPDNMTQPAPGPGHQTRISLAAFALAHSGDHYGQMVEYLRMNGFTPQAAAK